MTCIVGIEHDGRVTIAGDSAGTSGWNLDVRADQKVFTRDVPHIGTAAFGFTSSFRMGQIIRYAFDPPSPQCDDEPADIDAYLVAEFVPALRTAFDEHGYEGSDKSGRKDGGTFLLGIAGRLYCIEGDYQVGRSAAGYNAVGCGAQVALGALHATDAMNTGGRRLTPKRRVDMALLAAERFNGGVRGPFHAVES